MKAFCKDKLAHYKVPRYLDVVDSYPMTVTGKVRKVEMREQAVRKFGLEKAASIRTA
jgi:fatty-acyl-CoA synthase